MRTNFNLFVLKTMIGIREVSEECTIITLAEKFFDKEALMDCILTLHEANINHKCYRLWSKPNKQVEITVRMGAGMTNPVKVEGVMRYDKGGCN